MADAVRIEIDTDPEPEAAGHLWMPRASRRQAPLNGKVIRTGDTAGSLTVNLASDNAAAATVPATITLGEGARYGTFTITPTDDSGTGWHTNRPTLGPLPKALHRRHGSGRCSGRRCHDPVCR